MSTRLDALHAICDVLKTQSALKLPDAHPDAAFLKALSFETLRHYSALDHLTKYLLNKPLSKSDFDVHVLLCLGLCQLYIMDLAPHAAINETVALTRRIRKPWASGLINAALRRFTREQEKLINKAKKSPVFEHAHPEALLKLIERNWPDHTCQILQANNQHPPFMGRVNLSRTTKADYISLCGQQDVLVHDTETTAGVIIDTPVSVDDLPGFRDGLVSIQDLHAQYCQQLLAPEAGMSVLDACAAPGGKTCLLLEQNPGIKLTAIDKTPAKIARIQENLNRLGLKASLIASDILKYQPAAQFERILIDAPCSGSGIIRRHPDIKHTQTPQRMVELEMVQAAILAHCWLLLAPGGTLVYATCSIYKEENELMIARFLEATDSAEYVSASIPNSLPRKTGLQLLPQTGAGDGFFYAKLKKAQ